MTIVERNLSVNENGAQKTVCVRILMPRRNAIDWSCDFDIGWPAGHERGTVHGIDSVQALILCLQMVASALYASDYHKAGALSWHEAGAGYGFPLPAIIMDMATGADRTFFSASS